MKIYTNRSWMYQKYVVEDMSAEDIARLCGVTFQTIYTWLDKFGLK